MRKSRRLFVALAVSALVAAGGVTAGRAAHANVLTTCDSSATVPHACQIGPDEINFPTAITLVVTLKSGDGQNDQYISMRYQGGCTKGGVDKAIGSPINNVPQTPISTAAAVSVNLRLPYTDPDVCGITVTAILSALVPSTGPPIYTTNTTGSFQLALDYTQGPSPTPSSSSPPPVPLVRGYAGKCLDDKGNSSANRTRVMIWTCNTSDPAQGWTFSNGQLKHNGKCANDQGNGGSGSKVILWTCSRSPNELWFHPSNSGEFILVSTTHGIMCLTDPGYSKTNGTQLIVYTCHNTSDQHWSA